MSCSPEFYGVTYPYVRKTNIYFELNIVHTYICFKKTSISKFEAIRVRKEQKKKGHPYPLRKYEHETLMMRRYDMGVDKGGHFLKKKKILDGRMMLN